MFWGGSQFRVAVAKMGLAQPIVVFASLLSLSSLGAEPRETLSEFEFKHHDNRELESELQKVAAACPDIASVYELDHRSVLGQPLWVIEITDNPGIHEQREYFFHTVGRADSPLGERVSARRITFHARSQEISIHYSCKALFPCRLRYCIS